MFFDSSGKRHRITRLLLAASRSGWTARTARTTRRATSGSTRGCSSASLATAATEV